MWRNTSTASFIEWLRGHNDRAAEEGSASLPVGCKTEGDLPGWNAEPRPSAAALPFPALPFDPAPVL